MDPQGTTSVLDRDEPRPELEPMGEVETSPTIRDENVLTQQVRYYTAICSFAAGLLHLLAMAAHADHHPAVGRAFLAVAALQFAWGVVLIVEPRRLLVLAGALVTAGATVVWILTRTKGISWFPGLEAREPIEWRDTVTQFFQLLALAGAALLLVPKRWFRPAAGKIALAPIAVFAVLTLGALSVLYAATYNYTHHEPGGTESGDHDH